MATDRYRIPDPKCQHKFHAFRVSSHIDLVAANANNEPHCSTWVCDRPHCIEDAKQWVWVSTQRPAVVFNRLKEQVSA